MRMAGLIESAARRPRRRREDLTDLAGEARQGDQPHIGAQIYEQVDVTLFGLVAASHAAEDANVARSAPTSSVDPGPTMATQASTERRVREPPT
jgi:hypothetical protein